MRSRNGATPPPIKLALMGSKGGYDLYLMMSLLELWASTGYMANYVTQPSIAHLPKDKLEIVPVPVPTPHEQRAIAEALSDVDRLLEAVGGADRQEACHQAGRHAATPHR